MEKHDLHSKLLIESIDSYQKTVNERFQNPKSFDCECQQDQKIEPKVKLIAFYLPQFHSIPENDAWWGKGFTEWTNVTRAKPFFEGHNQPNLPTDLGFYDLRIPEVMEQQIEMAITFGIHAFCFHYYWFAGKRLLEKPIDMFLKHKEWNFHFCICWANENWTRRWNGLDHEILIAQEHSPEDDIAFLDDAAKYLLDSRYIRIDNKPLLIIYRPQLFKNMKETSERWRLHFREKYGLELFIAMTQTFGKFDPREYNLDAAVEFPPHNVPARNLRGDYITTDFKGNIFSALSFSENKDNKINNAPYNLFRGLMLNWDNTPRRGIFGNIYLHNTPLNYGKWLIEAIEDTIKHKESDEEKLIFINAWNEWGEGTHLEPASKYGYGYLKMTNDVLKSYDQHDLPTTNPPIKRNDHALIMHLQDIETWTNSIVQLQRVFHHVKFDLYLLATSQELESAVNNDFPDATILISKNQGNNQLPLIKILKLINALNYLTVISIQSGQVIDESDGDFIIKEFQAAIIENPAKALENIMDISVGLKSVNNTIPDNKPIILKQSHFPVIISKYSQLFFSISDDEFNEDESIIIENPGEFQKFSFLATKTVKHLRFDPLNNYSIVHLQSVHILRGGNVIDPPLKISSNALHELNNTYLFDTVDPQFFIEFSDITSVEVDEVIVELDYLNTGVAVLPLILTFKNTVIKDQEEYINRLSESFQKLEQKYQLTERNAQLIRDQTEIISSLQSSKDEKLNEINELKIHISHHQMELLKIQRSFAYKVSRILLNPRMVFRSVRFFCLFREKLYIFRSIHQIRQSGLFNEQYYLQNNPDVAKSGMNPARHYLLYGGFEGRNPSEKFDSSYYLEQNPDVRTSGMNPLLHYIRFGKNEQRKTPKY